MADNHEYKRILHRLGYYNYQQGLIYRHLNQEGGWNSHLKNCRNFILKCVDICKPARITVMGSGWLLDFPLAELAETSASVVLADIVHPPEVYKQIEPFRNVRAVELDVTGGLPGEVWRFASRSFLSKKKTSLSGLHIPAFRFSDDPGMLISLNIMSQLEVLPIARLKKRTRAGEGELLEFRKTIQKAHLDLLEGHQSVLITDSCEVFTDRQGVITENRTIVTDLPPGRLREEWTWEFDLRRSDYNQKSSVMRITALLL